jgi:hypothetical protein
MRNFDAAGDAVGAAGAGVGDAVMVGAGVADGDGVGVARPVGVVRVGEGDRVGSASTKLEQPASTATTSAAPVSVAKTCRMLFMVFPSH